MFNLAKIIVAWFEKQRRLLSPQSRGLYLVYSLVLPIIYKQQRLDASRIFWGTMPKQFLIQSLISQLCFDLRIHHSLSIRNGKSRGYIKDEDDPKWGWNATMLKNIRIQINPDKLEVDNKQTKSLNRLQCDSTVTSMQRSNLLTRLPQVSASYRRFISHEGYISYRNSLGWQVL